MRLGELDELFEQMKHRKDYVGRLSDPICLVQDAPTVDAVPVVRCKECKYWTKALIQCNKLTVNGVAHCTNPDWFCADGERRENDANNVE